MKRSSEKSLIRVLAAAFVAAVLAACSGGGGGGGGTTLPDAPTNVTATPGPGYIKVEWAHSGARVNSFQVYREGGVTTADTEPYATVSAEDRSFVDRDVQPGEAYDYSVVAKGSEGSSQPAEPSGAGVIVEPGVDLVLGRALNNMYAVFYVFLNQDEWPEGDSSYEATLSNGQGWTETITLTRAAFQDGYRFATFAQNEVAGEYELELIVGGTTYSATAEYDPTNLLAQADNLHATYTAAGALTVSWDEVEGAVSYGVVVINPMAEASVPVTYTRSASAQITGLNLTPDIYLVEVRAYAWDRVALEEGVMPEKPHSVNVSVSEWHTFAVGDPAVCADPGMVVEIPDAALRTSLESTLGSGGEITCLDLQTLRQLWVQGLGIESLEGLQYAVNLTGLAIYNNEITDLSPIAGMHDLMVLYAHNNPVESLEPVASLTNLMIIEVSDNDMASLAALTELHELRHVGAARMPNLTDLSPLAGKALNYLWLNGDTGIEDFSLITEFTGLQALLVGDTQFSDADLQMVSSFTNLGRLQLWSVTGITDLTPIIGLPLYELDVGGTSVSDLSPVYGMAGSLVSFSAFGLGLSDAEIGFLTDFSELDGLWLHGNALTDLGPLVANPGLGEGDFLDLRFNCLDISEGSAALGQIMELENRGVQVDYGQQGPC